MKKCESCGMTKFDGKQVVTRSWIKKVDLNAFRRKYECSFCGHTYTEITIREKTVHELKPTVLDPDSVIDLPNETLFTFSNPKGVDWDLLYMKKDYKIGKLYFNAVELNYNIKMNFNY